MSMTQPFGAPLQTLNKSCRQSAVDSDDWINRSSAESDSDKTSSNFLLHRRKDFVHSILIVIKAQFKGFRSTQLQRAM